MAPAVTILQLDRRTAAMWNARRKASRSERFPVAVPHYRGLTREEAIELRFGPEGAPRGTPLVFIENALPEADGSPYDWSEIRGTPAWDEAWAAEREALRRLPR